MLAFRALVMTVCTIEGDGLSPQFLEGDRVVINRWSYGLRTGKKDGLFDYGRICQQKVEKGDFIAFEDLYGRIYSLETLYIWIMTKSLVLFLEFKHVMTRITIG